MTGRKKAIGVLLAVASLALAACGSSEGGGSLATGSGVPGKTLILGVNGVPPQIDSQNFTSGVESLPSLAQFTVGLLQYAPLKQGSTTLGGLSDYVPGLASSYKETPQGMVFTLRDAKAGNGDVLTPEDVAYTYQRDIGIKDAVGEFLMGLAGVNLKDPVTILGPHTVRVNGKPTPLYPLAYTFYDFSILDAKVVKEHATPSDPWATKWLATHSADFGAYDITSFEPNKRIAMTANPNYYAGASKYPNIVITAFGGQSPAQLLNSNTIQFGYWIAGSSYKALKSSSSVRVYSEPSLSQDVLTLDYKFKPFSNPKVRMAMSEAINRAELAAGPYFGLATPAVGPVPATIAATANVKSPYYTYNLAGARELMKEAGYANGFSFTLTLNSGEVGSVDLPGLAADLQSMLGQIGIKMTIQNVANAATFTAGQDNRSYQAYVWSEAPIVADAAYDLSLYYGPTGTQNLVKVDDPTFNTALATALRAPVGAARDSAAVKAVEDWNSEMLAVPLVDTSYAYAGEKSICGVAPSAQQTVRIQTLSPCTG